MYSRHSRDESQNEVQLQENDKKSPRSISPILAQGEELTRTQAEPTKDSNKVESQSDHDSSVHLSPPSSTKEEGVPQEAGEVSPRTSAKLQLDELVSEHAHLLQPASKENGNIADKGVPTDVQGSEGDRALEFENLVDTDESTSEPPTSSTTSLLDDEDLRR